MATAKDLKDFNDLWIKLQQASGVANPKPFPFDLFGSSATTESRQLYVDLTGKDVNPGTQAQPYRTIQAALDSLPKTLNHRVTINVGSGNFQGVFIDGFETRIPANPNVDYAGLEIRGTMVAASVATGTNSGSITAYSAASGATLAVVTDNTQNWTVDDLKGKFLAILSGTGFPGVEIAPPLLPIVANTATTITVLGPATGVGATYQIQESGTIIDTALTPASVNNSIPIQTLGKAGIVCGAANRGATLGFSRLKISLGTNLPSAFNGMGPSGVKMIACRIQSANSQGVTSVINASALLAGNLNVGQFTLAQCSILVPNNCSAILFGSGGASQHSITTSYVEGGSPTSSSGVSFNGDTKAFITGCFFKNLTSGIAFSRSHSGGIIISNTRIDGGLVASSSGIVLGVSTTLAPAGCSFITTNVDISNCVTAISLNTPLSQGHLLSCTGTGNTSGIVLNQGAKLKVAAAVTLTGTSEVVLDGAAATTLATMRAASPKLVTNTYGTLIYE